MSFAANEELYNVLESRMDLIKEEMISRATNTDDIELKRALTRCLYHHGWVEANLRHCRPAAERSACRAGCRAVYYASRYQSKRGGISCHLDVSPHELLTSIKQHLIIFLV